MAKYPGFVGGSYTAASQNVAADRAVNLIPEIVESGTGKNKVYFRGRPGLSLLATLPAGQSTVRGMWAGDSLVYVVGTDKLYKVTSGGTVTLRGNLNSAVTPARMCHNGNQLLVVSGDEVFLDNGVSVTSVLSDGYVSATFLDGYFIALQNPTATNGLTRDRLFISALFDGGVWNPLEYKERQGSSDRLVLVIAHNQQLWLFGQQTTECWYNSGNADFPFDRIQGSQQQIGALPWTIVEVQQSLVFLGADTAGSNIVYQTQGFSVKRISNHAVEQALANVLATSLPESYTYQEGGHHFYVLNLPTTTWVYDFSTGLWHERGIWNSGTSSFNPHLGRCAAHLYINQTLVGASASGKIYQQAANIYSDDGAPMGYLRQAPHVAEEQRVMFHARLQVDIETGTQSSGTPTALMKYSDDGAHTWSANKSVALGAVGNYKKRAVWRRLGDSRDRVYSVTLPDLTSGPCAIVDAFLDLTPGTK